MISFIFEFLLGVFFGVLIMASLKVGGKDER